METRYSFIVRVYTRILCVRGATPRNTIRFIGALRAISVKNVIFILSGGSLGSWIDEGRSQLRYLMRIADTLSIDHLNAHCGTEIPVPVLRLSEGCNLKCNLCVRLRCTICV